MESLEDYRMRVRWWFVMNALVGLLVILDFSERGDAVVVRVAFIILSSALLSLLSFHQDGLREILRKLLYGVLISFGAVSITAVILLIVAFRR